MIHRYIFFFLLGLIACTSVTNRKNNENSNALEKQFTNQDTNSTNDFTSEKVTSKLTDSIKFFEMYTEALSNEESIRIKRNPEFRFQ